MSTPDQPHDALLVQLYSCFSEDTHYAGWLMDPWEPHTKRQFTDWLRRHIVNPAPQRPFEDYEKAALETLRECWAEAHTPTASEAANSWGLSARRAGAFAAVDAGFGAPFEAQQVQGFQDAFGQTEQLDEDAVVQFLAGVVAVGFVSG